MLSVLTNIAAALRGRPDLQKERPTHRGGYGVGRPGHIFHPSEEKGYGIPFGHGPVFRDLNFDKDHNSVANLLEVELPVSLIPYDVACGVSRWRPA